MRERRTTVKDIASRMGVSHHSTEDIAIMRALPNMVVMAPCDAIEAEAATHAMIAHNGPVYYRCGYKNESDIHEGPIEFKIGKAIPVCDGDDLALFFTGPIGYDAKAACKKLAEEGVHVRLVSMHSIKPIDREEILCCAKKIGRILTVEEHNLSGGLGSAVSEVLADENRVCQCKRMALGDVYVSKVGSQGWLREQYGLGTNDIHNTVKAMLAAK